MSRERSLTVVDRREDDAAVEFGDFYAAHYLAMVRLAGFLLAGSQNAEDVAQEAFVKFAATFRSLRDPEESLAYLRQMVINACRQIHRHNEVVNRHASRAEPLPEVHAQVQDGYPDGIQIGELSREQSRPVGVNAPWQVTVPVDLSLGQPATCVVAAQPTHYLQTSGSDY